MAEKLRFPIIEGERDDWPEDSTCAVCGNPNDLKLGPVSLSGICGDHYLKGVPWLEELTLSRYRADPDVEYMVAYVPIVRNPAYGSFRVTFCSPDCLMKFFAKALEHADEKFAEEVRWRESQRAKRTTE